MNKIKLFNIAFLLGLFMITTSCEKYFDGVNDNPNQPTEVPPSLLLPSAQGFLAFANAGDLSRFTSLIVQHVTGVSRQFATYQTYSITETEMDNWWRFNTYGGAMQDLYILSALAEAEGHEQYAGMAKILQAYGIMIITDMFGDAPFSEAWQGAENVKPAYDSQSAIYTSIQAMLADAKAHLSEPQSAVFPSSDDLIYGGDAASWIKFANVLSARAYLHLGKVDPSNYTMALNALGVEGTDSYGSDAESAVYNFGLATNTDGAWFQYINERDDIAYTGWTLDWMNTNGDPRYVAYLDTASGSLGNYFSRPDAAFFYASYVEQKFIEAEAAHETNDLARAAIAHNAGVLASLARYGVTDATFVTNFASETAGTIDMDKIMTQKHIAMYLDPEAFTDWRRTGVPALVAVPGNVTSDVIPRRLPYPQSERLYNGENFPADNAITSKVWWDN